IKFAAAWILGIIAALYGYMDSLHVMSKYHSNSFFISSKLKILRPPHSGLSSVHNSLNCLLPLDMNIVPFLCKINYRCLDFAGRTAFKIWYPSPRKGIFIGMHDILGRDL